MVQFDPIAWADVLILLSILALISVALGGRSKNRDIY